MPPLSATGLLASEEPRSQLVTDAWASPHPIHSGAGARTAARVHATIAGPRSLPHPRAGPCPRAGPRPGPRLPPRRPTRTHTPHPADCASARLTAAGGATAPRRPARRAHALAGVRRVTIASMSAPQHAPAERDADRPSRRIGRFTVLGLVGRGGLGEVYAAYDPELDRRVALKVLAHADDRAGLARLRREAMAMARLSHPNVARVFDVGNVDSRLFIAMEFIRGQTLRTWLAARPRAWREIRDVFLAAGQGLAAAHREGIVHRDFKPDNVLIDEEGRARVVDFGLAIPAADDALPSHTADEDDLDEATQPSDAALGGTPAYMAPEQHLGRSPDARADQFGFCVALFEALYGRRPFLGRTWQTLSPQVLRGSLEGLAAARRVPPHLKRVVFRGLSAAPERRFPDMDALLAELAHEPAKSPVLKYMLFGTALAAVVAVSVALALPAAPPAAPEPRPPAEPEPSPGAARLDLQVDALMGQLTLARALRSSERRAEALQVFSAVADAARKALGPRHSLSRQAQAEHDALAAELAR